MSMSVDTPGQWTVYLALGLLFSLDLSLQFRLLEIVSVTSTSISVRARRIFISAILFTITSL